MYLKEMREVIVLKTVIKIEDSVNKVNKLNIVENRMTDLEDRSTENTKLQQDN